MEYQLPTKQLFKYSFVFSGTVAFIMLLSSLMHEEYWSLTAYRVVSSFALFYGFCLINIFILRFLYKTRPSDENYTSVNNLKIFFVSWAICTLILISHYLSTKLLVAKGVLPAFYIARDMVDFKYWKFIILPIITFIMYGIVFLLHNFILLQNWKIKINLENSELKAIHSETVNQLLKQQIQPHFLFNALNVLKSLIKKYPDKAENYLLSLSDFLRASINQNRKSTATLQEELKICRDYMEMQGIRFGNAIEFKIDPELFRTEGNLPAFSLQPLLENAIKHNEMTVRNPLLIEIQYEGDWVAVINKLQPKEALTESTKNGLSNLSERYRLLSGDRVLVEKEQEYFKVKLKILNSSMKKDTVEYYEDNSY